MEVPRQLRDIGELKVELVCMCARLCFLCELVSGGGGVCAYVCVPVCVCVCVYKERK